VLDGSYIDAEEDASIFTLVTNKMGVVALIFFSHRHVFHFQIVRALPIVHCTYGQLLVGQVGGFVGCRGGHNA